MPYLPRFFHVFEEALLDEVLVDGHAAQPLALGDLGPEHEAPMSDDQLDVGSEIAS
jgi:hypothetical protein